MNHRDTHPKSDGQNHRWKKETIQLRPYKWSWASCDHTHQHPPFWIGCEYQCSISEGKSRPDAWLYNALLSMYIYIYYHVGGHLSLFIDSRSHALGRRITIQISQNNGNLQVCKRGLIEATTCYIFQRFNETPFSLRLKSRAPFDGQTDGWSCLSIPRIYGRIFWVSVVFRRIHYLIPRQPVRASPWSPRP